jgi:hypothetical protein
LEGGDQNQVLALRKVAPAQSKDEHDKNDDTSHYRDGIILAVGDHFNYIIARDLSSQSTTIQKPSGYASLLALVDDALDQGNLITARAYLSTQGGHGRISSTGWTIDCAIEPWREGESLWGALGDELSVHGDQVQNCDICWNGEMWQVFDTTFQTVQEIKTLILGSDK